MKNISAFRAILAVASLVSLLLVTGNGMHWNVITDGMHWQ